MAKTVLQSAVSLLPTSAMSVVAAVGGVTVVGLTNIGYRWSIRIAWAFTAAGTGLLVLLDADSTASIAYGLPVIRGAGIGLLLRLLFLPLQASVVRIDDSGLVIGILLTFRLLSGLVVLSICSTIFCSYFSRSLDSVGSLRISLEHLRNPEAAVAFIPQLRALDLPDATLEPIIHAYLTSIRAVVNAMTGSASLGFVVFLYSGADPGKDRDGTTAIRSLNDHLEIDEGGWQFVAKRRSSFRVKRFVAIN
jgi:hypothetical protein